MTLVMVKLAVSQNLDSTRNQVPPASTQTFDSPFQGNTGNSIQMVTIDSVAVNSQTDAYWLNLSFVKDWKFADSLAKDSGNRFTSSFAFQIPSQKIAFNPDPYNPYNHEEYARITRNKSWSLWSTLVILIYFVLI